MQELEEDKIKALLYMEFLGPNRMDSKLRFHHSSTSAGFAPHNQGQA